MSPVIAPHPTLLLAELSAPVQWAVLGVAVAGTAIVLFKPKFLKRDPLKRSPQDTSLSQQRSVERQMQNLLVELSEMARQVTSTLDTRAAKLDLLIREADEKIAVLTTLQADGVPHTAAAAAPRMETFANRSNAGMGQMAARVETSSDEAPFTAASSANASPYEDDARHAEVYLLADQGQSSSEIAAQLRRPNGEIQLILALRPDSKANL